MSCADTVASKWLLLTFPVSVGEMVGAGYEKGAEAADRRNNQTNGRSS